MAGTFLGANAPSLFFMPRPRWAASGQGAALLPGCICANAVIGCPPRLTIDPMADRGGAA